MDDGNPKSIEDLKADPKNPRTMDKHDAAALKNSMDKFGDLSCVVFNVRTKQLVGGHQRLEIMKLAPARRSIVITQRFEQPDEVGTVALGYIYIGNKQFAYREVDWDEGTQKAANIAANRIQGQFNIDLLAEVTYELSLLENGSDLLALTGQTEREVNSLLDSVGAGGNPADDEAPPVDDAQPAISKLGEIYQLGPHRLMCGDSTDFGQVSDLMDGAEADMVFTDPPYGMDLDTDFSDMKSQLNTFGSNQKQGGTYDKVIGDDADYNPAHIFEQFPNCKEIFLWGGDYYSKRLPDGGSWFVWDKRLEVEADKMYGSGFELCWSLGKHKRDLVRVKWAGLFGTETQDIKTRIHPTQKPLELCSWFISKYSERGKNIVDLFGGSGSTLIACDKLERICYMMEIDNRYIDVIIKRWQKHSGEEAVRIEDGKTWNQLSQETPTAPKTENITQNTIEKIESE